MRIYAELLKEDGSIVEAPGDLEVLFSVTNIAMTVTAQMASTPELPPSYKMSLQSDSGLSLAVLCS